MSRLSRRFGALRWRLMLSFFVAAWAAMMTLEAMFVIVPGIITMNSPQRPVALAQGLERLAPSLAPALALAPPDRSRLAATLATLKQPIRITAGLTENVHGTATIIPGGNAALFVVDQSGALLAALPSSNRSYSDLDRVQTSPEARTVVAAAFHPGARVTDLITSTSAGQTLVAAPIVGTDGVVRGALLLGVDLSALVRPIYLANLLALVASALLFAVIASIFGAGFGLLTARGLTRRLSRLTTAADAWSQGDFVASAHDPSSDELGQLARDLNHMAEQLQSLLQDRQRLAAVEERNRLARDLHDSVKQQMFALTMLIGSAQATVEEQSEARQILLEAERIAGAAQQELTALIHALRPEALTHQSLSAALRELCDTWARRTELVYDVHVADDLALTPSAEQDVFRTVQEALANVARHSGATRVGVNAERQQDALALSIRDNGHGFDVAQTDERGVGLRSMRERIESLGGTLHISSSVGGTRIEIGIPLSQRLPIASPTGATASAGAVASHEQATRIERKN